VLTLAEFLRERALAEDEVARGDISAAIDRNMTLLKRFEALSEDSPLRRESIQHCSTLANLAYCLLRNEQPDAAEEWARKALTISDALLKQRTGPKNELQELAYQEAVDMHTDLLNDLGVALGSQGQYVQAEEVFEDGLKLHRNVITRNRIWLNLATLANRRGDTVTAQKRYTELLDYVNDPNEKAAVWYNLGGVALDQNKWSRAVDCFRESLALYEQINDTLMVATVCEALAAVAQREGRHEEAEIWYQRSRIVHSED
jgi:tetratricopeptide (TPR) repeat protein